MAENKMGSNTGRHLTLISGFDNKCHTHEHTSTHTPRSFIGIQRKVSYPSSLHAWMLSSQQKQNPIHFSPASHQLSTPPLYSGDCPLLDMSVNKTTQYVISLT